MDDRFLLLLNGTFAAGKSTAASLLVESFVDVSICDWDVPEINDKSIKDVNSRKQSRTHRLLSLCEKNASLRRNIIIPNTIINPEIHESIEDMARRHNMNYIHVVLMIDKSIMKQRISTREINGSITDESAERTYQELKILENDPRIITLNVGECDKEDVVKKLRNIINQHLRVQ